MPVYIGKSGDLAGCYRCLTHRQTTEYSATQLVSSIKFKLSHAIRYKIANIFCVQFILRENRVFLNLKDDIKFMVDISGRSKDDHFLYSISRRHH